MSETAHEFDSNKKQRKNAKVKVDNKKPAMLNHWFSHLCHAGKNEREVWLQKDALSQAVYILFRNSLSFPNSLYVYNLPSVGGKD